MKRALFVLPLVTACGGGLDAAGGPGSPAGERSQEGALAFSFAVSSVPPVPAVALSSGDFDGDGRADVVVGSHGTGVGVMLGNQDGSLRGADSQPASAVVALAPGDFDGNGKLDFAMQSDRGLALYVGVGGGRMSPGGTSAAQVQSMAAADLDGDGKTDLVLGSGGRGVERGQVAVLLRGSGQTLLHAVPSAEALALADMNGDGKLDIVAVGFAGYDRALSVLIGSGGGNFTPGPSYMIEDSYGSGIVAGDLDGDGHQDVVIPGERGFFDVYLGRGDGTLAPKGAFAASSARGDVIALVAADFNGGGRLDLAALVLPGAGQIDLSVIQGYGDGTFTTPVHLAGIDTGNTSPAGLTVLDADDDGRADLAVTNLRTVDVYLNRSSDR